MGPLHPLGRLAARAPAARRLLSLAAVVLAAAALTVAGCGKSAPAPDSLTPPVDPSVGLDVPETLKDLGALQWGGEAKAEFRFRNTTSAPRSLSLSAATCSCLKAELEPKTVLAPGQQGRLTLQLNTVNRLGAGKVEGSIRLTTNRNVNAIEFTVRGYLEGISSLPYVLRPRQLQTGKIPDLLFSIVTAKEAGEVEVTGITCYRDYVESTDKGVDPAALGPEGARLPLAGVEPVMTKMKVSAPSASPRDGSFIREASVPIRVSGNQARTVRGKFHVTYRLRGEQKVTTIPLLILVN
jgi:hypothetical protein